MTVFCITVSAAFGEQESRISSASEACLRGSLARPSYFGTSKQSCRKAGFYILLWRFHGEVVIPGGRKKKKKKKKKRFQPCLLPALRLPYTSRLLCSRCSRYIAQHYTRSRMERRHCSGENKRMGSELQSLFPDTQTLTF